MLPSWCDVRLEELEYADLPTVSTLSFLSPSWLASCKCELDAYNIP